MAELLPGAEVANSQKVLNQFCPPPLVVVVFTVTAAVIVAPGTTVTLEHTIHRRDL